MIYSVINAMVGGIIIRPTDPTPAVGTLSDLLDAAGDVFGFVFDHLGTLVNTLMAYPILFLGFLISLVGLVVGIARRLINLS